LFRKLLGVVIVAALAVGCPSDEPAVPTTVNVSQASVDFDAVGATQQLSATVLDQDGDPIADANVTWSSGNQQIATVDNTGLVMSAGNGTTQITASAAMVSGQATVNVNQVPTDAAAASGDAQSGLANSPLSAPVVVSVLDRLGSPIADVAVMFTVTAGNGSVDPANTTTDPDGEASTTWTLGPDLGANALEAEVTGFPTITFNASAVSGEPEFVIPQDDNQTATVNTAVAVAPSVLVTDGGDIPLEGVMVTFAVASGGGSITGEDQTTDVDGIATVGSWTLGETAGDNTLSATVSGVDPQTITATGLADVATQIMIATTDPQIAAVNSPVPDPPGVLLLDQFDNPVSGVDVDFDAVTGGGIVTGSPATSGGDGIAQVAEWQLGAAEGTNEVEATVAALGLGPVTFTAEAVMVGPPSSVVAFDGDGQTGLTGAPINFPPAVQVMDANMIPVPDAEVVFTVESGGGMVTGGTVMTDDQGVATVGSWTIGAGANTLDATVTGGGITGNPVTFDATGISAAYDIEIRHLVVPTASQAAAFDAAAARWEELVIGDLDDFDFTGSPLPADFCGLDEPILADVVDDVLIYSMLEPIDGPGNVLGSAGPCAIRPVAGGLTLLGIMRFDTDDLDDLEVDGTLDEVILHEMGHVIGLGTLWSTFGFLENPSLPNNPGVDTHYDGPLGIKAFDLVGGATYVGGAKVPVENDGMFGAGTRDGHWREAVFSTELMTGILGPGAVNPLSIVTVASFGDMGYVFNLSDAEAYVLPAAPAVAGAGAGVTLVDDIWRGPLYSIDASGRITLIRADAR
jgi:hypothetical protein